MAASGCTNPRSSIHDLIAWSDNPCDMQRFIEKYGSYLPQMVRVSDGYAGRDESVHLFAQNEVYWVYDVVKQERLLAIDDDDKYISIPMDYNRRFQTIDGRHGRKGTAKQLADLVDVLKAPDIAFMLEGNQQVTVNVGADSTDRKRIGRLSFESLYDLKYLLVCPIIDRHLHPHLLAIPTYIPMTVDVATGFKYGSVVQFQQFGKDLQEAVMRFSNRQPTLCHDILILDQQPDSDYDYVHPDHVIVIDCDSRSSSVDSVFSSSPTDKTSWTNEPVGSHVVSSGNSSPAISPTPPANSPPARAGRSGINSRALSVQQINGVPRLPRRSTSSVSVSSGLTRVASKPILLPPMPPRPSVTATPAGTTRASSVKGPPVPPRRPVKRGTTVNGLLHQAAAGGCGVAAATGGGDARWSMDHDGYLECIRGDPGYQSSVFSENLEHEMEDRNEVMVHLSMTRLGTSGGGGGGITSRMWNSHCRRARSTERLDELTPSMRRRRCGSTDDLDSTGRSWNGSDVSTLVLNPAGHGYNQQDAKKLLPVNDDSKSSRSWGDIGLVPTNIASLSVEEVSDCLWLLHLNQYSDVFQQMDVDGQLLVSLNADVLVRDFNFSTFDAIKLMKFAIEGWRPLKLCASPD